MHPLYGALPVPYVPVQVTQVLLSHIGTPMHLLAAEPRSIAGHLFPGQCLCGTILVIPCSMVWDWWVSRAGSMPFHWPSCSLTFCLLLFSLSLLSFYGLVLWGWGLQTDRVLLLSPSLAVPTFSNNNNNNNNNNRLLNKLTMHRKLPYMIISQWTPTLYKIIVN